MTPRRREVVEPPLSVADYGLVHRLGLTMLDLVYKPELARYETVVGHHDLNGMEVRITVERVDGISNPDPVAQ